MLGIEAMPPHPAISVVKFICEKNVLIDGFQFFVTPGNIWLAGSPAPLCHLPDYVIRGRDCFLLTNSLGRLLIELSR